MQFTLDNMKAIFPQERFSKATNLNGYSIPA